MILVSVIIPVYNSEKHIDECIQSLIKQSLPEIELIFVDDGSTDNSANIIESYALSDSRIKIIRQNNKGISGARNVGLTFAKGTYIGFCDNDDVVDIKLFETLYQAAKINRLDIVISKTILGRDNKKIVKPAIFETDKIFDYQHIQERMIPNLLQSEDLFAVWNKLYNADFLRKFNVRFPDNRDVEEDAAFNIRAFNNAESVLFLDYAGYHFKEHEISESRKFIDKDYFKYALQKYQFDYKKHYNLNLLQEEVCKYNALRFISRVVYLSFVCSLEKSKKRRQRYEYISKMLFHREVRLVLIKYKDFAKQGKFERLIYWIIENKSKLGLYLLINFLSFGYHPKLSEIFRKLNNGN